MSKLRKRKIYSAGGLDHSPRRWPNVIITIDSEEGQLNFIWKNDPRYLRYRRRWVRDHARRMMYICLHR